jgi:uncharacterized membrane protein
MKWDAWIISAMVVGLALRLFRLGDAALWFDETFTASWVQLPWGEMLRTLLTDNQLPLYFVSLKAWTLFAGTSPWALRLPGALCSWALVPLCAALAHTVKGQTAARWAAWFAALSPYLLQHAQDARMYALLGVLAGASLLLLARFLVGKSGRLGTAFVVFNAGVLATHYYGVIFIGAEFGVLFLLALRRWRDWLPAMGLSLMLVIVPVLAAKFLAVSNAGGSYDTGWIVLPGLVWSLIGGYTLMPSSAELHAEGAKAVLSYLPFAVAGLLALVVIGISALRAVRMSNLVFLAGIIGVVIFAPFLVSFLFPVAINPRYSMAGVPAVFALLAAGSAETLSQRFRVAASVALVVIMVCASALHLYEPGHGREDIYAAGQWLDTNVQPGDSILVTSDEMALFARFHWPNRSLTLYPDRKTVVDKNNVDQLIAGLPFTPGSRAIYLYGREWLSDPKGLLRERLRALPGCPGVKLRGIEIFCITAKP